MKQKNLRKSRAERAKGLTLVEGNGRHVVIFPGIEPTLQERSIPLAIFVVSQRCMSLHILGEQKLSFNQINWYLADKYSSLSFLSLRMSQDTLDWFLALEVSKSPNTNMWWCCSNPRLPMDLKKSTKEATPPTVGQSPFKRNISKNGKTQCFDSLHMGRKMMQT